MAQSLLLNKNYLRLGTAPWQKSLALLWQGKAEALDDALEGHDFASWVRYSKTLVIHPSGFVRTPRWKVAVPDLVRLLDCEALPRKDAPLLPRRQARARAAPKGRWSPLRVLRLSSGPAHEGWERLVDQAYWDKPSRG